MSTTTCCLAHLTHLHDKIRPVSTHSSNTDARLCCAVCCSQTCLTLLAHVDHDFLSFTHNQKSWQKQCLPGCVSVLLLRAAFFHEPTMPKKGANFGDSWLSTSANMLAIVWDIGMTPSGSQTSCTQLGSEMSIERQIWMK